MYLGLAGAGVCLAGTAIAIGFRSLDSLVYLIAGATGLLYWAMDDVLYHRYGWKMPCYWIEQFLRKFKWWRDMEAWINKLIGGKADGSVDKQTDGATPHS